VDKAVSAAIDALVAVPAEQRGPHRVAMLRDKPPYKPLLDPWPPHREALARRLDLDHLLAGCDEHFDRGEALGQEARAAARLLLALGRFEARVAIRERYRALAKAVGPLYEARMKLVASAMTRPAGDLPAGPAVQLTERVSVRVGAAGCAAEGEERMGDALRGILVAARAANDTVLVPVIDEELGRLDLNTLDEVRRYLRAVKQLDGEREARLNDRYDDWPDYEEWAGLRGGRLPRRHGLALGDRQGAMRQALKQMRGRAMHRVGGPPQGTPGALPRVPGVAPPRPAPRPRGRVP
jgi:hypothetical protein